MRASYGPLSSALEQAARAFAARDFERLSFPTVQDVEDYAVAS